MLSDEEDYLEELYADDEELPSTSSTPNSDKNELMFVQAIESVGKILLSKSQTPTVKTLKKKNAARKMCEFLLSSCSILYTPDKIVKKVANLKQRVKKKSDMKATGNAPIRLKESEQLLLNLLQAKSNPSITCMESGFEIGIPSISKRASSDVEEVVVSSTPPQSSAKRRRISATSNTTDLQANVLQNQLKLIDLQNGMFKAQEARSQEEHEKKMVILNMKEKLLAAKIRNLDKKE